MNSARQSIHGASNKMVEDARTALGNQFVGLRLDGGGCMNDNQFEGAPDSMVEDA